MIKKNIYTMILFLSVKRIVLNKSFNLTNIVFKNNEFLLYFFLIQKESG